jgi:hypothetical protein
VLPGSSFGEKRRKRVVVLVLTVLVFRHLPIRTYAVFCLFASREKEGEIFKIHYIKFKTNGHKFPLKRNWKKKRQKIFKKKEEVQRAPKQNSSQHEFPVWIPAWPMCNEITSLIVYYLRCF